MKKSTIITIIVVVLVVIAAFFVIKSFSNDTQQANNQPVPQQPVDQTPPVQVAKPETVIGSSVEGRDITAYHYGSGSDEVLFIGGIHGGYEWNTSLVGFQLMDYLAENPSIIPSNVKATVIPVLNPDGLFKVVGTAGRFTAADVASSQEVVVSGRFNSNTVDLNRNFDCDWQSVGKWQNKNVSGGSATFSEPESQAIKAYVETRNPKAVVVWYSAAGGVFASSCHNGVLPETKTLTNLFAKASGYRAYENFNFYEITGDMVNWFAKMEIPAISVLLTNHTDTEWSKNRAGVDAVLKYFASDTAQTAPATQTSPAAGSAGSQN